MGGSLCAASQLVMHNRAFGSSQASMLSSQAAVSPEDWVMGYVGVAD